MKRGLLMKISRTPAVLFFALFASNAALADIVTFDDSAGNSIVFPHGGGFAGYAFSEQGLTFTNHGSFMDICNGFAGNDTTNANCFSGYSGNDYEAITRQGGGKFNVESIDMVISEYDTQPMDVVSINGANYYIGTTLSTLTLNLNNISELDISGVASTSGYWAADNINFSTSVPEPATWAMLILGMGAMGAVLRRRREGALVAA